MGGCEPRFKDIVLFRKKYTKTGGGGGCRGRSVGWMGGLEQRIEDIVQIYRKKKTEGA